MQKIKVLAIFRYYLSSNTGTPLRVRSILSYLLKDPGIDLAIASWDKTPPLKSAHVHLTNDHLDDLKKLYRYVKKHNIDVILGHTMGAYYYMLPLKVFTKAKIVLEMHGFIEEEGRLYGRRSVPHYLWNKLVHSFFYMLCDLITTCSETATKVLSRYNGNVVTVFGGVDVTKFFPMPARSTYIQRKKTNIIIGYAGNDRKWQGLDFLAGVYAMMYGEYPEFRLALLLSEHHRLYAGRPGITCFGPLPYEEVPKFLADCDILVVPRPANRVNELSFPSKLPEFMAMGKAMVASRTSDMHRIITDGHDGLLYDPGDAKGLKAALLKLRDPRLRQKLGRNAAQTASRFSWERQAAIIADRIISL